MPRLCALLFVLLLVGVAPAETVTWSIGKTLDLPVTTSTPTGPNGARSYPRTIVFPNAIQDVPSFWTDDQVYVKPLRNTLIVQLRDPLWKGVIQVYDDRGSLYLLAVRAAKEGEKIDDQVIVRPMEAGGGLPGTAPPPVDTDSAVVDMIYYMFNGAKSHPMYSSSLVTRMEADKIVPGRILYEDDSTRLTLVRVCQGPNVRGYECTLTYRGERSVRFNPQSLYFPGALAVWASNQVLLGAEVGPLQVEPRQTIQLFYVAE